MEFQRQTAYKVKIKDVVEGRFVKQENPNPSYLLDKFNRKISRVNIIGTIISKFDNGNNKTLLIDDNTGRINLIIFNDSLDVKDIEIGDMALIIGRVREYNGDIYIVPEIIRKEEDIKWAEVRKRELELIESNLNSKSPENLVVEGDTKEEHISIDNVGGNITEDIVDEAESNDSPVDKIYNLIKELDAGEGADIEEIIEKSSLDNAEAIIKNLLMEGQIYEVRRGKVKVL